MDPARARPGQASRSSTAASSPWRWRAPSSTSTSCATSTSRCCRSAQVAQAGPFGIELLHLTHSIPDSSGVALQDRARHDPLHRRLQVRPDARSAARPPTWRGSPSSAARACCCCAATRPTPTAPGISTSESVVGPQLERLFAHCPGRIVVTCFASNIHRVQQVVDAAAALDRKVALVGRSMRKNVNIGRSLGHIDVPEGHARPAARDRALPRLQARDHLDRVPGRAAVGAAPDGLPRPPVGRAQVAATPSSSRPRRSPATSARSTRRSTASTTSAATSSPPATRRSTPPATATRRS